MLEPKDINSLHDFSKRNLSASEHQKINKRLAEDSEYEKEAAGYFAIFKGFKGLEIDDLQNQMNQWESNLKTSQTPVISMKNNMMKYAVAAVLLLALLPLGYQFLGGNQPMSTEEIFAANFSPEAAINIYSSRSVPEGKSPEELATTKVLVSNSAKGVDAYNSQQYTEAIQYFNAYLDVAGKKNTEIKFYLSVSYLAANQFDRAIAGFEELTKKGSKARKMDAEWYLVLTLIKSNNVSDAQSLLDKITNKKKHYYQEKALVLKQQLEKHLLK